MRAIRDLRDLVNVSRLTYRDDSDNELENDFTNSIASLNLSNNNKPKQIEPKQNPIFKSTINNRIKPNSPNYSKLTPVNNNKNVYLLNSVVNNSQTNMILRERDQLLDRNTLPLVHFSINLKKPLPPLKAKDSDLEIINPLNENDKEDKFDENEFESSSKTRFTNGNFDEILTFIDASVVSDWLNRANRYLKKMLYWHQDNSDIFANSKTKFIKYEPYVLFCNFWLGNNENIKLNDKQRRSLIEMEYSIISEEVMQAFQVGIESQSINRADVNQLLKAVLKEYPIQLLSFRGTYLILDFIDILCSDRANEYKKILSDVKCRTLNKQYAQWLLSIRSFALINLCWSIIKFYKKTIKDNDNLNKEDYADKINEFKARLNSLSASSMVKKNNINDLKSSSNSSISSVNSFNKSDDEDDKTNNFVNSENNRKSARLKSAKLDSRCPTVLSSHFKYECYLEAVFKNDLPDVLHYFISTKKIDPCIRDSQGRTLIFKAVMNEKPKLLNYLVKRWACIDINETCDSGNTPLHAAVNKGNLKLVEILLESQEHRDSNKNDDRIIQLDVNKANPKCMNATALHLAVWNDYNEIAIKLVQNNADPYLKMNGEATAFDLAKENSNEVLHDLLLEYSNIKSSR
ncbi:unnamed protein product [Brachionus calyciflorus]|uniref:SIPAR domain-containing protein n=1 Tax=Brachionus calyciflorus TaxID=104777 RepID=A0A813P413_9BILA|nr:unnamed protein product [Brachionus calyciflorus]